MFCSLSLAWAQEEEAAPADSVVSPWKYSGAASLSFSNVGLSNWAGGGDNSISIGSLLDGKMIRETDKSTWNTYLNTAFGLAKVGGSESLFKKTDDQFILGTNYGLKFSKKWSFTGSLELRTQFAPGFTYTTNADGQEVEDVLISQFFAPGYLNANLGIQYANKVFSFTFSPLTGKTTFVLEDSLSRAGAFGVKPGEKVRFEFGDNINAKLELNVAENVTFKTALNLFTNYETLGNTDVNWETLLVFKVNKFINASFGTQLIYDDDILIEQTDGNFAKKVQFKHVLNLNIGYKFSK
jgi:hypothetical protein